MAKHHMVLLRLHTTAIARLATKEAAHFLDVFGNDSIAISIDFGTCKERMRTCQYYTFGLIGLVVGINNHTSGDFGV